MLNIQAVTIKIPIIMSNFIWAFAQSYLGLRCSHVSYTRHCFSYFAVEYIGAFKIRAFRSGFLSGHYIFFLFPVLPTLIGSLFPLSAVYGLSV